MSTLFGGLGFEDGDYVFAATRGQKVIWNQTLYVYGRYQQEADDMTKLFVESTTTDHSERYRLPENSLMDKGDFWGEAPPSTTKPAGYWMTAYPLYQTQKAKTWNDISRGYLTLEEYSNFVEGTFAANANRLILDIMYPIFQNAPAPFNDPIWGSLDVVPLANGDATLYPPVVGSYTEATENMYLAPGFTESQISYVNDPFRLARLKLEAHWGYPQGGSPITAYISTTCAEYAKLHPNFVPYPWNRETPGDDITLPKNIAPGIRNARSIGEIDNVKVVEWPRIPTGYSIFVHEAARKPLKRRVDPKETGLKGGLQMIPGGKDNGPLSSGLMFRRREGYAVGCRIGACVVQINGSTTYTPPSIYATL